MDEKVDEKEAKRLITANKVVAYLILVLLSLVAFGFGGSSYMSVYLMFGVILALAVFTFSTEKIDKAAMKKLLYFAIPLIVVAIFGSISNFWLSYGVSSISGDLISMFGVVGFFLLGYAINKCKDIKISYVLFAILGGIALLVLISTIYALARYGFFYIAKYPNSTYFYDGAYYEVAKEIPLISGFSFKKTTVNYATVYPFVLASSLLGLLFISPKKQRLLFYVILGEGAIGLLSMLVLGNFKPLLFLIPVIILALLLRFVKLNPKNERANSITGWILLGIFSVLLLILIINAIGGNFFKGNKILNKIFNNSFLTEKISMVINMTSVNSSTGAFNLVTFLFGAKSDALTAWSSSANAVGLITINPTAIEFIMFYEGGFIAFAGLLAFMLFVIWSFRRWLREEETISGEKAIIICFVFAWIVYMSFKSSVFPYIYSHNEYVSPFRRNGLFYIVLLLIGYSYRPLWVKKAATEPSVTAAPKAAPKASKGGNDNEISL